MKKGDAVLFPSRDGHVAISARKHPLSGGIGVEIAPGELWEDGTRVAMDYSW
ncbi:hypothetical protein ACIA48_14930 [Mycobacterium sp. NPDC051804]|uniref:hypothetical protein n=1 Tax=Mycobacterium sp. NPDC051804 TaxID=3364295 RepID=UPI0037B2179A